MPPRRRVHILGVPMDLGASRRGVDMGPSAIRIADLQKRLEALGYACSDLGNIPVPLAETRHHGDRHAKFLSEIALTCRRLFREVTRSVAQGALPVVLGGDHSMACGTLAGVAKVHRGLGRKVGLLWFDAHGDANTPGTTASGNIHGMPLAALLGQGPRALTHVGGFAPKVAIRNAALVAVRELDPPERRLIRRLGLRCFTMKDIDARGIRNCVLDAIDIASRDTAGFHVSFDMDAMDPSAAPGVGTPVKGGLSYREAHLAMETVADSKRLLSFELAEVNPVMDRGNETAVLASELISSALGKKIL